MYIRFLSLTFLLFIALSIKAQTNNNVGKRWVLKGEIGATTRGFSDTNFYEDNPDNFYGDLTTTGASLLKGIGFHSNLSYGYNFGSRYYMGTSLGYNSQNTSGDYNINTLPVSMHFKINYFKNQLNTLYVQGNLGYALPLRNLYRGVNFGYNIGYQFVANKISKHLLGISLQNQVQNIRGVYIKDFVEYDPATQKFTNYGPFPYSGRYKLSGWGLNLAYTF